MPTKIIGITGADVDLAWVGRNGVTEIVTREQNLGEYGILWFDVYKSHGKYASYNGRYIASVSYEQPVEFEKMEDSK